MSSNRKYAKTLIDYEQTALTSLNSNFNCICGKRSYHFPKIIAKDKDYTILSNCGKALHITEKKIVDIPDHEEQLNCIFRNLVLNKLMHVDIRPQNICINNDDVISLIDFDMIQYFDDRNDTIISDKMAKHWVNKNRKSHAESLMNNIKYNYKHDIAQDRWKEAFFRLMLSPIQLFK